MRLTDTPRITGSQLKHYLVAVLSVTIALILTPVISNSSGHSLIALFFAAVAITSWYGGVKPGIVAVILSTIACDRYVFPLDSISYKTPASFIRIAQFTIVALMISYLTGRLKFTTQHLRNANRALEAEIQERTKIEAALKASEAELRAIFSAMPDPLLVVNVEGRVLKATLTISEQLYQPVDEYVGRTLHEIFNTPQDNTFLDSIQRALHTQQPLSLEYNLNEGEREIWFSARISPISKDSVIWLARDISDRKRAEEASILEERNRMAREIHDSLAQAFTGILIQVGAATQVLTDDPQATQAHLEMVEELARTGLTEARRSVAALRPQLLEDGDLHSALYRLVTQMRAATDTSLIFEIKGISYRLPAEVENNLLRIGQEALTNAIKYAHANEIRIELIYDVLQCTLRVKDDGRGFGVGNIPSGGGFGLLGMSERAKHIGANLIIQSQPGKGTEIAIVVNH
ncbi:histidine kinase [Tolypothrix bouteillei VB521301_2]|uniref:histidine kinase n=1 Tax=Tolypothrix bouteillei TaxID=1246981 RepID=UPI0005137CEE